MKLNLPSWQMAEKSGGAAGSQDVVVSDTSFPAGPFQECWNLHLTDPVSQRALQLRFSILVSNNGFRRVAEAWAVFFQKNSGKETSKLALRETFDLKSFSTASNKEGFQIGVCEFATDRTVGKVQSKGQVIEWDLRMAPRQSTSFDLIPAAVRKPLLMRNSVLTPQPDLAFSGSVRVNGTEYRFEDAPGMQGHQYGMRSSHSWITAHCNLFRNEQGAPVPFVFEGICFRAHLLAGIPSPKISSFYLLYQGKKHHFNTVRDAVRLKSRHTLNDWSFQLERGNLMFRGHASFEHKDFAGFSIEDTNGSLIYGATSRFSNFEIHIYNRGKLESALRADQCASVEICSRKKNPYVPILF